ncbi:M23 family metallopeptidase [Roseovarius nanhaiticus]|uniref:M23 family metallopeptidase n=1 Tax=Roseovarius nanhaiticus TaxID=573024 RepID=UPI0024924C4B|nr:M23 family metallopeptidase [Roseovarius nanhaiticus]
MRIRNVAAGLAFASTICGAAIVFFGVSGREPTPDAIAAASAWMPQTPKSPRGTDAQFIPLVPVQKDTDTSFRRVPLLKIRAPESGLPAVEPSIVKWSRAIAPGGTLDSVLSEAGFDPSDRAEIALALGAEYDLRRLRPGHSIAVISEANGRPLNVSLEVEEGVRIEVIFGEELATKVITPEPDVVTLASEAVIESSLFRALEEAGIPARFAVDLGQMLGGTVDFRREMSGGEKLRLMWREARVGDDRIRAPDLAFAALEMGGSLYEVIWPEDGSGRANIYVDGELLRVFAQPVDGARLSSVFGRRTHPVYGNVRMHTGVDFAAAQGTPVKATAPGRISFIGRRGGYGRVVEISHGSDTMTRYAHLSAVPDGLSRGQRVAAGDLIGRVGATGTATGPNLHYEVLVEGRPTDPLADERLAEAAKREEEGAATLARLLAARALMARKLNPETVQTRTERL